MPTVTLESVDDGLKMRHVNTLLRNDGIVWRLKNFDFRTHHAVQIKEKHCVYVPSEPCLLRGARIEPDEFSQAHLAEVVEQALGAGVRVANSPRAKAILHDGSLEIAPCTVDDRTG